MEKVQRTEPLVRLCLLDGLRQLASKEKELVAERSKLAIEKELADARISKLYQPECALNSLSDAIEYIEKALLLSAVMSVRTLSFTFHLTHVEYQSRVAKFPHWPTVLLSEEAFKVFAKRAITCISLAFVKKHPEFEHLIQCGNSEMKIVWTEK